MIHNKIGLRTLSHSHIPQNNNEYCSVHVHGLVSACVRVCKYTHTLFVVLRDDMKCIVCHLIFAENFMKYISEACKTVLLHAHFLLCFFVDISKHRSKALLEPWSEWRDQWKMMHFRRSLDRYTEFYIFLWNENWLASKSTVRLIAEELV